MAQVAECLPRKFHALSPTPSTVKTKAKNTLKIVLFLKKYRFSSLEEI
jgi:hypothetical protein